MTKSRTKSSTGSRTRSNSGAGGGTATRTPVKKGKAAEPIRTGRPMIRPDATAHLKGIKEGNAAGNYAHQRGHLPDGRSTAARSTGINPRAHDPIDPRMPNLSPA
ncbi:hypothetical protein [Microtetraspora sp. NBRC 16547]|uniref:hypothetical protein n=1 Tax=Microtetraspora sp. NBRC 16547 TaxID=3030993 RepID=UPI0024A12F0C|nr:hypothetical protein [Microtetraspora sp. NBRC 16547]GLW99229.1 hypothetical protein Misp02_33160 [Microtetraspora sp. NBRC 16547]